MPRLPTFAIGLVILGLVYMPCGLGLDPTVAQAQGTARTSGPSGFPVPRFVALRGRTVNLRRGPSRDHPIDWVYRNYAGLPVKVIAETELWRRIEDHEGVVGWVHRGLLDGTRTALVLADRAALRSDPADGTTLRATVGRGAIGKIETCAARWCEMRFEDVRGWMKREALWGLLPGETVE